MALSRMVALAYVGLWVVHALAGWVARGASVVGLWGMGGAHCPSAISPGWLDPGAFESVPPLPGSELNGSDIRLLLTDTGS